MKSTSRTRKKVFLQGYWSYQEAVHSIYSSTSRNADVVFHPRFKKDAEQIERVQRRATKLVPRLRNMSYENRLNATNLPSLVYRRYRGDMIEVFKYLHGLIGLHSLPVDSVKNGSAFSITRIRLWAIEETMSFTTQTAVLLPCSQQSSSWSGVCSVTELLQGQNWQLLEHF